MLDNALHHADSTERPLAVPARRANSRATGRRAMVDTVDDGARVADQGDGDIDSRAVYGSRRRGTHRGRAGG